MPHKVSRNAACPCGTGKKYKNCCYEKGFDWVVDDDGEISRRVPMTQEMAEVFTILREAFIAQHGREPGPDDRVFEGAPPLEWIEHQTVEAMKRARIDPGVIFAYVETGMLVCEENEHLSSVADLEEWHATIDVFERETGHKVQHRILTSEDMNRVLRCGPT